MFHELYCLCTEQLTKQLQRERQKLREIQGSAVQSSTQAQAIKDLEEQIRDLQVYQYVKCMDAYVIRVSGSILE